MAIGDDAKLPKLPAGYPDGSARPQKAQLSRAEIRRVAFAGGIGTLIEYYDYGLYGYVATIIASQFFPSKDPTASLLSTLAVFALSYIIRPVGGIVFGTVGDKLGRKKALMITVVGIGVSDSLIGILPTYAVAGIMAPVLLVIVRISQGFFAGGEVGGAPTVIADVAPPHKRARYGALTPMGTNGGLAIASAFVGIMSGTLMKSSLDAWGWRVPFLVALPLTAVCYLARRRLPEIDHNISQAKRRIPLLTVLRDYPKELGQGIALGIGVQGAAYIGTTFLGIYLVTDLGYPKADASWLTAGCTAFAVCLMPFTGRLADRIGTLKVATIGLLGYAALSYPALIIMNAGNLGWAALGYIMIMVNMAFVQVASFTLTPQLFPEEVRYTGTSLATNFAVLIAGGTAPYVATWLVSTTNNLRSPYYFVAATIVIGLTAVVTLRTRRNLAPLPQGVELTV